MIVTWSPTGPFSIQITNIYKKLENIFHSNLIHLIYLENILTPGRVGLGFFENLKAGGGGASRPAGNISRMEYARNLKFDMVIGIGNHVKRFMPRDVISECPN